MRKYILILVSVLFVVTTAQATDGNAATNDTIIESTNIPIQVK